MSLFYILYSSFSLAGQLSVKDDCTLIKTVIEDNLETGAGPVYVSDRSSGIIFREKEREYVVKELKPFLSGSELKQLKALQNRKIDTIKNTWDSNCFPGNYLLKSDQELRATMIENRRKFDADHKDSIIQVYFFSSVSYFHNDKCALIQVTGSPTFGSAGGHTYLYKKNQAGLWNFVTRFNFQLF